MNFILRKKKLLCSIFVFLFYFSIKRADLNFQTEQNTKKSSELFLHYSMHALIERNSNKNKLTYYILYIHA
jgi:hypothetical protein